MLCKRTSARAEPVGDGAVGGTRRLCVEVLDAAAQHCGQPAGSNLRFELFWIQWDDQPLPAPIDNVHCCLALCSRTS